MQEKEQIPPETRSHMRAAYLILLLNLGTRLCGLYVELSSVCNNA